MERASDSGAKSTGRRGQNNLRRRTLLLESARELFLRHGYDATTMAQIARSALCFSLDGRRLLVNDTARQHIRVFDVKPDGTLSGGRVWAETRGEGPGAPDGMKLDSAGKLYCCGPGGIHVFNPDAVCLGVIHVPEYTANMAWGDADYRSLYITASTSVYRIRAIVPGLPAL